MILPDHVREQAGRQEQVFSKIERDASIKSTKGNGIPDATALGKLLLWPAASVLHDQALL